ncbi:MAG TPA: hypothetical protein VER58_14365 [Thermoanaerobaculia bacterium]|nr:hypothetical protein [Thermoanaerobaculia bacterium]
MISLLLVGFIIYLYTPHLLFKAAAATRYEFMDRKGLPQIEEFFSAALPSFFLNLKTVFLINAITWIFDRSWFTIDRHALSQIFVQEPQLKDFVAGGKLGPLLWYLVLLAAISWQTGLAYAKTLVGVARAGGPELYFDTGWRTARKAFQYFFWRTFYWRYEAPHYPPILRQDFAFVRTGYGLFHGLLYAADKNADGDIEGITLVGATKINFLDEDRLIRRGKVPMTELSGPIFLRWNQVTDINYPTESDIIERMRAEFEARIERSRERRTLAGRLSASLRALL